MTLILELVLLFAVIFFAVRLATTGHVDSHRQPDAPKHELVYQGGQPIS